MFGVVLALTLAGLLFFLVLPLPRETPFLVRQTFMLIWLYMVPALWVSTWLPAARVFRCLPLSRIRLAGTARDVCDADLSRRRCLCGCGDGSDRASHKRLHATAVVVAAVSRPVIAILRCGSAKRPRPKRELRARHLDHARRHGKLDPGFLLHLPSFPRQSPLDGSLGNVLACRNCWPSAGTRGLSRPLAQPCHAYAISTGAAVRTRIVNIPWAPITLAWAGGPPDRSRRAGQTRAGCTILRACRKQRGASAR